MNTRRIAFVIDSLELGGITRVCIDYVNGMAERGHEVHLVSLGPCAREYLRQLAPGVALHRISLPNSLSAERYATLAKRAWWGRFVYPAIFVLLKVLLLIRTPLMRWRLPECDVCIAFSGHFADLTLVADVCSKRAKKIAWLHGNLSSYLLISEGFVRLHKKFDSLVVLGCEGDDEFFLANHFLALDHRRIYNPIPIANAAMPARTRNRDRRIEAPVLVMVARLAYPFKDHPTLLEAVRILREGDWPDLRLQIVGDGPDRSFIEERTAELGLRDAVEFVGAVEDPSPYFLGADVAVLSSLVEGLPTVLLEAMAQGTPVVSSDARSGAREILGDSEFGLICKAKDPQDMAAKIGRVLGDPDLWEHYSRQGLKRVEDFAPDKAFDALIDLVDELVEARAATTKEETR